MTPIRTVTTPVFTNKPRNPVTLPTSPRVGEVTETNGVNGSNGSGPPPTPALAPLSQSAVAGSRNMLRASGCALATGRDCDGRCVACGARVLRSGKLGRSLAVAEARPCVVYGARREVA